MLDRYWPTRRFAAFAGAGAIVAAVGAAFAYPDAVAVGSTSASAREAKSSTIDWGLAVAVGRDGKPVVAGRSASQGHPRMALARYSTRGRLDRHFGVGGTTLTGFGSGSKFDTRAVAVAIQADGKVVLAGEAGSSFGLARYTARGRLDQSFGNKGKVETHFGSRRSFSQAGALAIQPDGKIVALGSWYRDPVNGPGVIALARYTPQGRLDPSFGHGGKVVTSFGPRSDVGASALLLQADGTFVVAGEYSGPGDSFAVALARYKPDGTIDPSFGTHGRVVSRLGGYLGGASAAVLEGDGKIVVDANDQVRSYLARYTVDGKLDSSFGHGGKAVASKRVLPLLALQRDGKLIIAGSVTAGHGRAFALRRYAQNGDVDSSFGRGGKVFTDFGSPAVANALTVEATGKIVVAGTRGFNDFAVARYTNSGRPDSGFGRGGKVTTDFGTAWRTR